MNLLETNTAVVTCTNKDNSHFLSPPDNQTEIIHCSSLGILQARSGTANQIEQPYSFCKTISLTWVVTTEMVLHNEGG